MPDLTLPGQPPPPLFFPPFPNEEKMRKGHLNAEAPLGLLGETHSVGQGKFLTFFSGYHLKHYLMQRRLSLQKIPCLFQTRTDTT